MGFCSCLFSFYASFIYSLRRYFMAGHSKWANINTKSRKRMHKRKNIYKDRERDSHSCKARWTGPGGYSKLKDVIAKAKAANMPMKPSWEVLKRPRGKSIPPIMKSGVWRLWPRRCGRYCRSYDGQQKQDCGRGKTLVWQIRRKSWHNRLCVLYVWQKGVILIEKSDKVNEDDLWWRPWTLERRILPLRMSILR